MGVDDHGFKGLRRYAVYRWSEEWFVDLVRPERGWTVGSAR